MNLFSPSRPLVAGLPAHTSGKFKLPWIQVDPLQEKWDGVSWCEVSMFLPLDSPFQTARFSARMPLESFAPFLEAYAEDPELALAAFFPAWEWKDKPKPVPLTNSEISLADLGL